jgi:hypothetical protein
MVCFETEGDAVRRGFLVTNHLRVESPLGTGVDERGSFSVHSTLFIRTEVKGPQIWTLHDAGLEWTNRGPVLCPGVYDDKALVHVTLQPPTGGRTEIIKLTLGKVLLEETGAPEESWYSSLVELSPGGELRVKKRGKIPRTSTRKVSYRWDGVLLSPKSWAD